MEKFGCESKMPPATEIWCETSPTRTGEEARVLQMFEKNSMVEGIKCQAEEKY